MPFDRTIDEYVTVNVTMIPSTGVNKTGTALASCKIYMLPDFEQYQTFTGCWQLSGTHAIDPDNPKQSDFIAALSAEGTLTATLLDDQWRFDLCVGLVVDHNIVIL